MASERTRGSEVEKERRIIIIDDEKDFAISLADILESQGYAVETAHSAADGAVLAGTFAPHVALLDVRLGMESGINVISALKNKCPAIHCVMMSAFADTETAIQALQMGAYDYLRKPLEVPDLLATVNRCLDTVRLTEERVAADADLRRSEERFRHIFESIKDVYLEVLLDGTIIEISPSIEETTAHAPDALMGQSIDTLLQPGTRACLFEKLGQTSALDDYEICLIHQSGRSIPCSLSMQLVDAGNGKQAKVVGTLRDITERKRAEKDAQERQMHLIQTDKMVTLGTLVAGVAHEINNPNNFIAINATVLDDIWSGVLPVLDRYVEERGDIAIGGTTYSALRSDIPQIIKEIKKGSDRIKNIVSSLKDFARQEAPDTNSDVDIAAVVQAATKLTQNLVKNSTENFSVEIESGMPTVRGSFQRLEQVVINLVINACDALANRKQPIAVLAAYDKDRDAVLITVRDGGAGMSQETINHAFDPFYTTRRDTGGTGLGLSITDGIVRDHGGSIRIHSVLGEGTEVVVSLPAAGR